MDGQDNLPNFRDVMGFDAVSEVIYEDDETDNTIPDVQKITKKNNILPIWGNTMTMNLNTLVLENIIQSTYYKNYLNEVTTFQQVSDEVYYNVAHLEPWERGTRKTQGMTGMCGGVRGVGAGGVISTAFCLLYKMFILKITRKQLVSMINSNQSVYLRGLGFMYIRYTQPPNDLWSWLEPYLDDKEVIDPRSGGGDKITIGQLVRMLLTKLDFYGTLFPRIPVPIQKEIELKFRERSKYMYDEDLRYRSRSRDRGRSRSRDRGRSRSRDRRRSRSLSSRDRRRSRSTSWDRDRRKRDRDNFERNGSTKKYDSKHSTENERKKIPGRHYKCRHHLRHHHCRKHRTKCPLKAKKIEPIKEETTINE